MHNQIKCLISVITAFVDYNKLRWNIHKCFILMFCLLHWHGEMSSFRKKCIWLSTLTCCAPVLWHKPLSCFTGSLLARCHNPLSFWSAAVFGTCCTMAPTQGAWDTAGCRTFGKTCAANTSEKSVRMRDHHPLSPMFFPYFHQWNHPTLAATVHLHCPL